jgi:exonuclease VII large subunit
MSQNIGVKHYSCLPNTHRPFEVSKTKHRLLQHQTSSDLASQSLQDLKKNATPTAARTAASNRQDEMIQEITRQKQILISNWRRYNKTATTDHQNYNPAKRHSTRKYHQHKYHHHLKRYPPLREPPQVHHCNMVNEQTSPQLLYMVQRAIAPAMTAVQATPTLARLFRNNFTTPCQQMQPPQTY